MKRRIQLLLTALTAIVAQAQTVCHDDGTVTFQYKNDQAREVLVDVQFAGRHAMTRDDGTGLWTVTLGVKGDLKSPVAPDMYPYCYIVDGVSVMDPENQQYFPNEGFKNSLLEITSKDGLPHDIRPVPHGQMDYIHYYSKSLGGTNQAVVYLPPKYKEKPFDPVRQQAAQGSVNDRNRGRKRFNADPSRSSEHGRRQQKRADR